LHGHSSNEICLPVKSSITEPLQVHFLYMQLHSTCTFLFVVISNC
jgi:hypothetical protein